MTHQARGVLAQERAVLARGVGTVRQMAQAGPCVPCGEFLDRLLRCVPRLDTPRKYSPSLDSACPGAL